MQRVFEGLAQSSISAFIKIALIKRTIEMITHFNKRSTGLSAELAVLLVMVPAKTLRDVGRD